MKNAVAEKTKRIGNEESSEMLEMIKLEDIVGGDLPNLPPYDRGPYVCEICGETISGTGFGVLIALHKYEEHGITAN